MAGFTYKELADGTYSVALNSVFKEAIRTAVIPETFNGKAVTEVSENAFEYATYLSKVVLPDSIKVINSSAFFGCKKLKEIYLPDGLTKIDSRAFNGCISLQSITIPNTVAYIGDRAFRYCTLLQSITIPSSVTYMGVSPFISSGLTKATFEDPIGWKTVYTFTYSPGDERTFVDDRYSQSDMSDEDKAAKLLCDTGYVTVQTYRGSKNVDCYLVKE